MELGELIKPIRIIQVIGTCETEIKAVNIDSRQVETGDLFMAMKGTQTDGHAYISTAIEKGAVAILCEVLPETLSDRPYRRPLSAERSPFSSLRAPYLPVPFPDRARFHA